MSIYQEIILEHYRSPKNFKPLAKPTATVVVNNPLCGDRLRVDVVLRGDRLTEIGFSGEGCAISIASASLLSEYVKGKRKKELARLDKTTALGLLGIDLSPNRIKCALLAWEGLLKVIAKA